LPLIEGPEPFGSQFQGGGYVESVQSPATDSPRVLFAEFNSQIEDCGGEIRLKPYVRSAIPFKGPVCVFGLRDRNSALKNLEEEGVRTFRPMQGCHQQPGILCHMPVCAWRMGIRQIERNEKACVGVNVQ
jgi:hypothetical protein